ncbi:insulinase family protein [uncultured Finegoldia sp.]|uniref:insulinase family protein n=1 Tax=uncultured Finegoldia sp. TaxID=328009 RepID=UPI0026075993|nr:insulinase family protein [uncultured Finegoldia sp.]
MQNYKNFKLIDTRELSDINSTAYLFEHEKTKAKILKLSNDDENKVFSIAFKTIPQDSTGVAHIMEHSVLNGSKKYTTREPFMDLVKSSLQTFLNAMTYPDKTCYPVASRNAKDFKNLVDVYLDAVFNPIVYKKKNIFYQEGWHYEIKKVDDDIKYNGVVYNEMKGAYSSIYTIIFDELFKYLYPDTTYSYSSGGNPYNIPDLTYEKFLEFHDKYYHPSNSFIYFYGNGNIEEELDHLSEYLDEYDYKKIDSDIAYQKPFEKVKKVQVEYNISKEENPDGKDVLVYAVNTGHVTNVRDVFVSSILNDVLFSNESAIIKEKLLAQNLCESVESVSSYGQELTMGVIAENSRVDKTEIFESLIKSELESIVKNGIDKDELTSTLNKLEYDLKEAGSFHTKGVIYFLKSALSFMYTDSYYDQLQFSETLAECRKLIDTDFYEKFIEEKLLNNNFKLILSLKATCGLNLKKDNEIKEKLKKYKESLSEKELNELIELNKNLEKFQSEEDSQEQKDTIPTLELEDIDSKLEDVEIIEKKVDDYTFLNPNLFTSNIHYASFMFDLKNFSQKDYFYLSLLSDYIGLSDTKNFDYKKLYTETYLKSGGIFTSILLNNVKDTGELNSKFVFSFKTIENTEDDCIKILEEYLFNVKFTDKNRFKNILQNLKQDYKQKILEAGNQFALTRSLASFSEKSVLEDECSGFSYYEKLCDVLSDFDDKAEMTLNKLREYYKKIVNRKNMIVTVINEKDAAIKFFDKLQKSVIVNIKKDDKFSKRTPSKFFKLKEAYKTSSNVNYVVKSADLKKYGFKYDSKITVLTNILNTTFLYNEIRAKGGAYGVGMSVSLSGIVYVYSYRDPNIKHTIDIYDETYKFIENMNFDEKEMKQFIIGTVNQFNPPMTTLTKGTRAINMYLTKQTIQDYEEYLDNMLHTTVDELKEFSGLIKKAMKENHLVVVGNDSKIEEDSKLFDKVINVE